MSNFITTAHVEAHEKLTARLFWRRLGENGYNDAGNVPDYADATSRSLVTRTRATNGFRIVNDEQVDVDHTGWTFTLDERNEQQERLIRIATVNSNQVQATLEGGTASITSIQVDRWYPIGVYGIANVAVTRSASGNTLEEGLDYEINRAAGRIKFLTTSGAEVVNGDTISLSFDQPGINFQKFTSQTTPLFYCDVRIEEFSQHSDMPLRITTCRATLNVDKFPTQTGPFGNYSVKMTAITAPVIIKRPEAATLPTHAETGEGAAKSSSSSSSSSASDNRSSSSSFSSQSR